MDGFLLDCPIVEGVQHVEEIDGVFRRIRDLISVVELLFWGGKVLVVKFPTADDEF